MIQKGNSGMISIQEVGSQMTMASSHGLMPA